MRKIQRKTILIIALVLAFQSVAYASTNWQYPGDYTYYTRSNWGAEDPKAPLMTRMRSNANHVVFHHTAGVPVSTTSFRDAKRRIKKVQDDHFDRNFDDIGYHYLIDQSGRIWEGRANTKQGAHATSYNDNIGISILGNYEGQWGIGAQTVTSKTLGAMKEVAAYWIYYDSLDLSTAVVGHRDLNSSTVCPGRNLYPKLEDIKDYLIDNMQER